MSQEETSNGPKALIIEPSKELAEQTLNNVKQFKKYVDNPKLRCESTLESINVQIHNSLQMSAVPAGGDCCIANVDEFVYLCLQGPSGNWWCGC